VVRADGSFAMESRRECLITGGRSGGSGSQGDAAAPVAGDFASLLAETGEGCGTRPDGSAQTTDVQIVGVEYQAVGFFFVLFQFGLKGTDLV